MTGRLPESIEVVDSHTEGEPTRVVISGWPELTEPTMEGRREQLATRDEALWRGVPCVCSDLPVLRENADGGGCLTARINDATDWAEKLRTVLTDAEENRRLQAAAMARSLPRWAETAAALRRGLNSA